MHGRRDREPAPGECSDVLFERDQELCPCGVDEGRLHPPSQLPPVDGLGLSHAVEQGAKALGFRPHDACLDRQLDLLRSRITATSIHLSAPLRAAWTGV